MVKDTTPSWCVMRECGLKPQHVNWFRVAMRLYNALTQSNSSTARKILQADMQLSSRYDDCWLSHILSAVNVLTQFFVLKERRLKCEPIDLGLLWTSGRIASFWYASMRVQQRTLHLPSMVRPTKRALVTHSPYILLKYKFLYFPQDITPSVAQRKRKEKEKTTLTR